MNSLDTPTKRHSSYRHAASSVALTCALCLVSHAALAQEESSPSKSLDEPIVVAPLDDNSSSEPVAIKLVDALRNNGRKTLSPPQVQNLLDRHKTSLNQVDTSRLSADVEGMKEGAQLYFYEGASAARQRIEKPLARALSDLPALAARKDLAEQTYEAAIVLLRAYHDEDMESEAASHALTVVTNFPSKQPSEKSTPPEIQQLLDAARAVLAEQKTTLQIKPFKSQRLKQPCRYFINGFDASSAESYTVSSSQTYHLQMDCGRGTGAIAWKHTPSSGEANAVPIIDVEPLQMTMQDSTFQSRTEIEQRILFVLHWTDVKTFIGVSKNGAMGTDQAALLVHVNASDRQALWSDGAAQDSLCTTLDAWFPGLQVNCDSGAPVEDAPKKKWPLVVAGAGLVAGIAGTIVWRQSEREIDRIRCSDYADPNGEPCVGVDAYEIPELDGEDISTLIAATERRRNIALGVAGGGALMLIGGVTGYLLSNGERSQRAERTPELFLSPTRGGAQGGFGFTF